MRLVELAHDRLKQILCPGDICIDATAGNGHDSLFLAQSTAPNGIVYAVDIQESAILETTDRLKQHGFRDQLKTIHESHENLDHIINPGLRGNIATIMFNLGYLPGGNHQITTQAYSTVKSVEQAYSLLRKKGIITIICYRGHDGGEKETQEVLSLCESKKWKTEQIYGNENPRSPVLVIIEKL